MQVTIQSLTRDRFESMPEAFVSIARDVPGEYWTAAHFRHDLSRKWELSLAAWHGNEPIGYAIMSSRSATWAHLHHFMLAAAWRRQGLGVRLLKQAVSRAAETGHRLLTLKVAPGNRARLFYEREGFAHRGEDNGYLVYGLEL